MNTENKYQIKRIRISGFRRLADIDLELKEKRFMVLIGANGVGKTSFLDALTTLSASASGKLNTTLSQFGGISSILTRGKRDKLTFTVDLEVPGGYNPLEYELALAPRGAGYAVIRETLSQQRDGYSDKGAFMHINSSENDIRYYETEKGKLIRPDWSYDSLETSLAQVPKMYRQPEELRRILSTATQYHVLDVGPRAPVKLPQPMKPATLPGPDGEDLVPYLYYLRETERNRFDIIIDSLKAAFPDFEEMTFPPVASGMLTMTWKDRNFTKPLAIHELSEGTLRFLWLVALLQSPNLSTVTMIDEPEVSLHPELLSLLADLMREASRHTQLIVATHSDRFVRFLKPGEVVVMDIDENGCTKATWADKLNLDHWLADYSLDEIWQMGSLGGRS
jgi:predicted ATPase